MDTKHSPGSDGRQNGIGAPSPEQIHRFLREETGLFRHLSEEHLAALAADARVTTHEPNEAVVEFGEDADFLGVLLEGELSAEDAGVSREASEISVVGHRVVHGGELFSEAVVVDDGVLGQIEALSPLAPLHNPVNAAGIREARRVFPSAPRVAVFDTAFHHMLASFAYLYGLPYALYEERGVRRYGFHGTSHGYACLRAAQHLGRRVNELEIVSCHLGNGASLCAVDHGRSVDTTMGFSPCEGLIMGTRCGDQDDLTAWSG